MPATKDRSPRFSTVQTLRLDYAPVKVTQYESMRTGMRVAVVDHPGPKVSGHFALATEIHDNSGAPHTLEHLIFMGSKTYQYKGLLDRLSSRAFSYTNAWTAVDHTAYILKTAGWEGFAQILPAYLEHLVVPTLTDAACYTEVHHVDGSGNDAGVVYAEMQGSENSAAELMERRARELMYPPGSGFRSETGGLTRELRSLTADRIRAFHKEMYQPRNLRLVLTGEVDHDELLAILDDFETSILDDVPGLDTPFHRPWIESEPTPVLHETKVETIRFPEEDESMGEILVGYLGPKGMDPVATSAMAALLSYLCGSSISVLENTLVEREQLCSAVYYSTDSRPDMAIWFYLTAVETEKLQEVYERLLGLLKETASKPLDMVYMHDCIKRYVRQIKQLSENGGDFFATPIIEDHLFGKRDGSDLKDLETLHHLEDLLEWSEEQWIEFLKKWFSDAQHVAILGVPSEELSKKLSTEEKSRVKSQQENLGEEGLKKLGKKLEEAQAENDKPIPDTLFEQWPVPRTDSVHFISTTTARSGAARQMGKLDNEIQKIIDKADDGSPLFIHFEHIPSNFVRMRIIMTTSAIPTELRPLLSLYISNLFTTPVMRDGKRIEFEDLVVELERETSAYDIDSTSGNPESLCIHVATEPTNYETMIAKVRTILFDAVHDPIRLYASLTKLLADIPESKRDGESMVFAVDQMISYEQTGFKYATNSLTKALYLKRLRKALKDDEQAVIAQFDRLCKALHQPQNFRVFVAADLKTLKNPVGAWKALTTGLELSKPLQPLEQAKSKRSERGRNPGSTAYLVPITSIDSSFALLTGKGPDTYDHPDLPALTVAIAFLGATEGPLWVGVRGKGLAYGAYFMKSPGAGSVTFMIYKSPDSYKAYLAAKEQIEDYASGKLEINKFAMESAVSEIVYGMASEQPSMSSAAYESFTTQVLWGVGTDYNSKLLAKVSNMSTAQVREAITKYLVPLFQPRSANLVITCATIMTENTVANFKQAGFEVEAKTLDFFQDDYGLKAPEGEDEADDDDDDDDDDEEEMEDGEEEDDDDDEVDTPGSKQGA